MNNRRQFGPNVPIINGGTQRQVSWQHVPGPLVEPQCFVHEDSRGTSAAIVGGMSKVEHVATELLAHRQDLSPQAAVAAAVQMLFHCHEAEQARHQAKHQDGSENCQQ